MKIQTANPEAVVKRAFYLAYQACRGPMGMGILQARSGVTEEDVWRNLNSGSLGGDYGDTSHIKVFGGNEPGQLHGDYVFGRIMKLSIKWDADSVEVPDGEPRGDYQSWCRTYPTYASLIEAAQQSIADESTQDSA